MAFSRGSLCCVIWIILVSGINVRQATAMSENIAHTVEVCPRNLKEWQIASRRMNCTNDESNPKKRYHCLPLHDLSTLMEFCFNEFRPRVVKGSCMLYVQNIKYLNGYNCSGFSEGCPNKMYFSDESYLFPSCLEIDPKRRCFVAESSCQGNTSENIQKSHSASTEINKRNDNVLAWSISLAAVLLLVVIVIVTICNWKKGACQQRILETFCTNSSESPTTDRSQSSGVAKENSPFLPNAGRSATASDESIRKDVHSMSDERVDFQTNSTTIEEDKTDMKEDKQSTSNKNKSKDVCLMPGQKLDSNSDWPFLESIVECPDICILNVGKGERVDDVAHISRVTSKFVCLDNKLWVVKIDLEGNIESKHELEDFWGSASSTVDENGDLLIIRQHNKVMRVTSNKEEPAEVFSVDPRWSILSVYFSRFSGEIILRIYFQKWHKYLTNIARYNKDGKKLFEFKYLNTDKLIVYPLFLSENINGDICIADNFYCHVIAFNNKGKKQYTYKGPPPHSEFSPTGICNDLLGHVLVCNCHTSNPSVHLLDKNGEFLKMIVSDKKDVKEPWGLCVDDDGKLYIGQKNCTVIKVFRYLKNR